MHSHFSKLLPHLDNSIQFNSVPKISVNELLEAESLNLLLFAEDSYIKHQHKAAEEMEKQINKYFLTVLWMIN